MARERAREREGERERIEEKKESMGYRELKRKKERLVL